MKARKLFIGLAVLSLAYAGNFGVHKYQAHKQTERLAEARQELTTAEDTFSKTLNEDLSMWENTLYVEQALRGRGNRIDRASEYLFKVKKIVADLEKNIEEHKRKALTLF